LSVISLDICVTNDNKTEQYLAQSILFGVLVPHGSRCVVGKSGAVTCHAHSEFSLLRYDFKSILTRRNLCWTSSLASMPQHLKDLLWF